MRPSTYRDLLNQWPTSAVSPIDGRHDHPSSAFQRDLSSHRRSMNTIQRLLIYKRIRWLYTDEATTLPYDDVLRMSSLKDVIQIDSYILRTITGASIPPDAMMHFHLVSEFPPISDKFLRLRRKFSRFYLFPALFFRFHPPKFLRTF